MYASSFNSSSNSNARLSLEPSYLLENIQENLTISKEENKATSLSTTTLAKRKRSTVQRALPQPAPIVLENKSICHEDSDEEPLKKKKAKKTIKRKALANYQFVRLSNTAEIIE